jgi:hypothetical protein
LIALCSFVGPLLAIAAIVIYARLFLVTAATQYVGVKYGLTPLAILRTYFIQVFAAIPWSGLFINKIIFLNQSLWSVYPALILVAFIYVALREILSRTEKMPRVDLTWGLVGLGLWLLPAIPIALSQKYQQNMFFGAGYLPVYLETFGLFLFLGACLPWNYRRLAVPLSIIVCITFLNNAEVVQRRNTEIYYPKLTLISAAQQGLFKTIPEKATLVFTDNGSGTLEITNLLYTYTGKHFKTIPLKDYVQTAEPAYFLTFTPDRKTLGITKNVSP